MTQHEQPQGAPDSTTPESREEDARQAAARLRRELNQEHEQPQQGQVEGPSTDFPQPTAGDPRPDVPQPTGPETPPTTPTTPDDREAQLADLRRQLEEAERGPEDPKDAEIRELQRQLVEARTPPEEPRYPKAEVTQALTDLMNQDRAFSDRLDVKEVAEVLGTEDEVEQYQEYQREKEGAV